MAPNNASRCVRRPLLNGQIDLFCSARHDTQDAKIDDAVKQLEQLTKRFEWIVSKLGLQEPRADSPSRVEAKPAEGPAIQALDFTAPPSSKDEADRELDLRWSKSPQCKAGFPHPRRLGIRSGQILEIYLLIPPVGRISASDLKAAVNIQNPRGALARLRKRMARVGFSMAISTEGSSRGTVYEYRPIAEANTKCGRRVGGSAKPSTRAKVMATTATGPDPSITPTTVAPSAPVAAKPASSSTAPDTKTVDPDVSVDPPKDLIRIGDVVAMIHKTRWQVSEISKNPNGFKPYVVLVGLKEKKSKETRFSKAEVDAWWARKISAEPIQWHSVRGIYWDFQKNRASLDPSVIAKANKIREKHKRAAWSLDRAEELSEIDARLPRIFE